jgi:GTP-binding protein
MTEKKIRNVAIIAHVDHGKTTLVDELFKQSGLFRENQDVDERLMDSMDLERERGITIKSKNGACNYKDYVVNIIDTPGHADFGGEVERVLKMADGAVFLVDSAEGPMPQSYFVLKKAIAAGLPIIVVVNKIDKASARCDWVVDKVFDLMAELDAPDHILDFPVLYASARSGISKYELDDDNETMIPVFDTIIKHVPEPKGNGDDPFQLLVSNISYSPFMGRLAVGKITSGSIKINQSICVMDGDESLEKTRVTKLYRFVANEPEEIKEASIGSIIAIAGVADCRVGFTITDPENPLPLPSIKIDPPTISMTFLANDSPFAGTEGEFVTGTQLGDRLERELLSDVALEVKPVDGQQGYMVAGRGELHLSILIERLRREGYEFQVSQPRVLLRKENGKTTEPYEEVFIEVPEATSGRVIETLGTRKGQLVEMTQEANRVNLVYKIPTRGLLGYQSQFMTLTKGLGVLNSRFSHYGDYQGSFKTRQNGVLISKESGATIAFSLFTLQERGELFLGPGAKIYEGQIIGAHSREDDLVVNPLKGKKLTNMRASGSDDTVVLTPPRRMTLEDCLSFIEADELVEVTPKEIRLRKRILNESDRKSQRGK